VIVKCFPNAGLQSFGCWRRLEAELIKVEKQVFDLESTYLTEAPAANLGVGFAALAIPAVAGLPSTAASKAGPDPSHRVFSASSTTSPLFAPARTLSTPGSAAADQPAASKPP
jgi:hypothetical protein